MDRLKGPALALVMALAGCAPELVSPLPTQAQRDVAYRRDMRQAFAAFSPDQIKAWKMAVPDTAGPFEADGSRAKGEARIEAAMGRVIASRAIFVPGPDGVQLLAEPLQGPGPALLKPPRSNTVYGLWVSGDGRQVALHRNAGDGDRAMDMVSIYAGGRWHDLDLPPPGRERLIGGGFLSDGRFAFAMQPVRPIGTPNEVRVRRFDGEAFVPVALVQTVGTYIGCQNRSALDHLAFAPNDRAPKAGVILVNRAGEVGQGPPQASPVSQCQLAGSPAAPVLVAAHGPHGSDGGTGQAHVSIIQPLSAESTETAIALPKANVAIALGADAKRLLALDTGLDPAPGLTPVAWSLPLASGPASQAIVYAFAPIGRVNFDKGHLEPLEDGGFVAVAEDGVLEIQGARACQLSGHGAYGADAVDRNGAFVAVYDGLADQISISRLNRCRSAG
ncbi:MAG: hypothetical protein Q8Q88_14365 [Phenylobacterium sp.]|uniref:hypothetical protein n=1 Tax=Phenylobacterium sp. TaxID=1871053 RepID=UPI0027355D95|nr:hypothetical protein [Phenylobacterium sp.]MDP3748220.1 hypothetical protein [Phenylobacterium sp.]